MVPRLGDSVSCSSPDSGGTAEHRDWVVAAAVDGDIAGAWVFDLAQAFAALHQHVALVVPLVLPRELHPAHPVRIVALVQKPLLRCNLPQRTTRVSLASAPVLRDQPCHAKHVTRGCGLGPGIRADRESGSIQMR